jgi:hypothetical protein
MICNRRQLQLPTGSFLFSDETYGGAFCFFFAEVSGEHEFACDVFGYL